MASVATMPLKDARGSETQLAVSEGGSELRAAQGMAGIEQHADWPMLSRLPMRLSAGIPLPRFKVKDLVALRPGQLVKSTWLSTDDVALTIGSVQLSWSEFEVVEQRMAVRLTRLA